MSGIDHDPVDLQAQRANHRVRRVLRGRRRRRFGRGHAARPCFRRRNIVIGRSRPRSSRRAARRAVRSRRRCSRNGRHNRRRRRMARSAHLVRLAAQLRHIAQSRPAVRFPRRSRRRCRCRAGSRSRQRSLRNRRSRMRWNARRRSVRRKAPRRIRIAVHIDDQPRRILQEERRIVADAAYVQHHPRGVRRGLRGADPAQKCVARNLDRPAGKLRRKARAVQVEEDAIRIRNPRRLIAHLLLQIDRDACISRRGPVANAGDQRHAAVAHRRRGRVQQRRVVRADRLRVGRLRRSFIVRRARRQIALSKRRVLLLPSVRRGSRGRRGGRSGFRAHAGIPARGGSAGRAS